jgi:hypothetical protein
MFAKVFIGTHKGPLFLTRWIQSISRYPTFLKSILILSSLLRPGLRNGIVPYGVWRVILIYYLSYASYMSCSSNRPGFDHHRICKYSEASSPILGLNILGALTSDFMDSLPQCDRSHNTVKVDGNLYATSWNEMTKITHSSSNCKHWMVIGLYYVRVEVPTTMITKSSMLWDKTPVYWKSTGVSEWYVVSIFRSKNKLNKKPEWLNWEAELTGGFLIGFSSDPADGRDEFLRKVVWLLTDYTALHPRR